MIDEHTGASAPNTNVFLQVVKETVTFDFAGRGYMAERTSVR